MNSRFYEIMGYELMISYHDFVKSWV